MAEVWDRINLDTQQAQESLRQLGERAKSALGESAKSADGFIRAIRELKKQSTLDRAKASSDDYRKSLLEQAKAARELAKVHESVRREIERSERKLVSFKGVVGGIGATGAGAAAALGLVAYGATRAANSLASLTQSAKEWAKAGAESARIANAFAGDISNLRAASSGLVDDTTLQRLSILGQRLGLTATQFEGLTARATQLYAQGMGASVAENLAKLVNPEIESMKNLGIVIDTTSSKYEGLSDAGRTLLVSQEQAAIGADALARGIDVAGVGVMRAETQVTNLIGGLQTWWNETLEGSGFLEQFRGVLTELETTFSNNEGTIKSLVETGLEVFIDVMKGAAIAARQLSGAMNSLDTALNGPAKTLGARELSNAADRAMISRDLDINDKAAVAAERARLGRMALGGGSDRVRAVRALALLAESERYGHLPTLESYEGIVDQAQARERAEAEARSRKRPEPEAPAPRTTPLTPTRKPKPRKESFSRGTRKGVFLAGLVEDAVDEVAELGRYLQVLHDSRELWRDAQRMTDEVASWLTRDSAWERGGVLGGVLGGDEEARAIRAAAQGVDDLSRSIDGLAAGFGNLAMVFDENASGIEGVLGRLGGAFGAAGGIISENGDELADAYAKIKTGTGDQTEAMKTLATTGLAAGKAFTAGLIKDVRAQSAVLGLFEVAESAASYPDVIGMAKHAFAAATYFAVAGGAGGGGRGASGSGGSTGIAHRANENSRSAGEAEREMRVTVNYHGIPVPDRTARELVDALEQGLRLKGGRLAA